MRFFEISVNTGNGFTILVKTNQDLPDDFDEELMSLAGAEGLLSPSDIQDVSDGMGFINERSLASLDDSDQSNAYLI